MYSQTQSERTLRARQLRAKGYSIGDIAKDLNFSKSTVYGWVKDIEKANESHERTERIARTNEPNERTERTLKTNSELKGNRSYRKNYTLFSSVSGKRRTTERTNRTNVRAGMICLVILIVIIVFILLFQDQIKGFLAFFSEDEETSKEKVSKEEDKSRGFEGRSEEDL